MIYHLMLVRMLLTQHDEIKQFQKVQSPENIKLLLQVMLW